jgi:hypothetical protein
MRLSDYFANMDLSPTSILDQQRRRRRVLGNLSSYALFLGSFPQQHYEEFIAADIMNKAHVARFEQASGTE